MGNRAAWIALTLGLLAAGIAVAIFLGYLAGVPAEAGVGVVGVVAVMFAIRALLRRRAGLASNLWAPALALVLTVGGLAFLAWSVVTPAGHSAHATSAASKPRESEAVIAARAAIRSTLANFEVAIEGERNTTNSLPAKLSLNPDGILTTPTGTTIGTVASGYTYDYSVSSNLGSYTLTITDQTHNISETYNSSTATTTDG